MLTNQMQKLDEAVERANLVYNNRIKHLFSRINTYFLFFSSSSLWNFLTVYLRIHQQQKY